MRKTRRINENINTKKYTIDDELNVLLTKWVNADPFSVEFDELEKELENVMGANFDPISMRTLIRTVEKYPNDPIVKQTYNLFYHMKWAETFNMLDENFDHFASLDPNLLPPHLRKNVRRNTNESRRINKLYTSINEFKSHQNYSDKKKKSICKNERFTRAKNYRLTMYCDTSLNDPDEFVEWLDYQDVALVSGFNYTRNTIYKDFNSYDEAFEVITWIIDGLKGLDIDGVERGASEDIVTGFEIKMNP